MKQTSLLMLGLSTLALTSCDTEIINQFPDLPNGQKSQLTVTGSVNESTTSRAVGASWEEGDEIGIIGTDYSNIKYVTADGDGVFDTENPFFFNSGTTETFYTYYPYTEDVADDAITIDAITAANETAQKPNDYLWATGTASFASPNLGLTFSHLMSKVIVNIRTSADDGFDIDDIFAKNGNFTKSYAKLYASAKCTFDIKKGTLSTSKQTNLYLTDPVDDTENHVRTYTILLAPQNGIYFTQMFTGAKGSETYEALLNTTKLAAGTTYTYNLVLKKKGLEIESAFAINDWTTADDVDKDVMTKI